MAIDKIKALKIENPANGGTQTDMFPTETNPAQDYLAAKGISFENLDTCSVRGDSGIITLTTNGVDRTTTDTTGLQTHTGQFKLVDGTQAAGDFLKSDATGLASWVNILSSDISNFASTVLATVLTGLSVASSTAITAADTVLSALGKLQAQITTLINRNINTGTGLSGGGNLSADRTIIIANTTVTAGSYGSASQIPTYTVNAQGQLTAAANVTIPTSVFQEVTATANTTTNSGTDGLMNTMTVTPVSGTYLVWFSSDFNSPTAGAVISISIYIGGTQNAASLRKFMPFTGGTLTTGSQRIEASTKAQVVVNGSQAIELRWSTSAGTMTAAARSLNILKVA